MSSDHPFSGFHVCTDHVCSVLESLLSVVYWFPFYYTFKFVFLLWLSLPVTRYGLSDISLPDFSAVC